MRGIFAVLATMLSISAWGGISDSLEITGRVVSFDESRATLQISKDRRITVPRRSIASQSLNEGLVVRAVVLRTDFAKMRKRH